MDSSVDAGTLLPGTKPVKQIPTGISYWPAPVDPPPASTPERLTELRAQSLALRKEIAGATRKQRRSPWRKETLAKIERLTNEIVALEHLPTATPPPAGEPTRVFTLNITRPVRRDGRSGFQWQMNFSPTRETAVEDYLLAELETGEPYQISFNGKEFARYEGHGWRNQPRTVLTIHAVATEEMLSRLSVWLKPVRGVAVHHTVSVPVIARQPFKVHLDGRLVASDPGE